MSNAQHALGLLRRWAAVADASQRHPSFSTNDGKRSMTTSLLDLGSSGCAVAPADGDNREKPGKRQHHHTRCIEGA